MLRLRVPHLGPCKIRSIQHRGPRQPHRKRQSDAVTAVLQVVANQKRGGSPLRSSIARPQGLSMGARGPLRPIRNVMHFSELAEYSQNARWEVHHLSAAGSMPWFCPSWGIGAAQKAPPRVARRGQQQVKRPYAYGRRTTKLG